MSTFDRTAVFKQGIFILMKDCIWEEGWIFFVKMKLITVRKHKCLYAFGAKCNSNDIFFESRCEHGTPEKLSVKINRCFHFRRKYKNHPSRMCL